MDSFALLIPAGPHVIFTIGSTSLKGLSDNCIPDLHINNRRDVSFQQIQHPGRITASQMISCPLNTLALHCTVSMCIEHEILRVLCM